MNLRLLGTTALSGALGLPASQTGLPLPGQEEPIFSAQSELVVLQVMVEDRHGRYVMDLSAQAFSVFEDGTPQTTAFFNRQDAACCSTAASARAAFAISWRPPPVRAPLVP